MLAHVAKTKSVGPGPYTMTGRVSIGKIGGGAFGLAVELVGAFEALAKGKAEALMHEAHGVCPYSNAVRGDVEVTLVVAGE